MNSEELCYATIEELAPRLAAGDLCPVELTRAQLDRIAAIDGAWRSYATVMAESALEAADRARQEIASGRYRGPLHGIPVAVKDLCFTQGTRTMGGTKVLEDLVPDFDSTVVAKFKSAGAILLGKLNLTEGAMGGYNRARQIPLNPWAPDRWTGASSSGSGVATAAGLCYASLGSDTGGSIRSPAAACGITGLKPTWGRVSRYGVLDLAQSLDHVGPMTRSTWDCAAVLETIAGDDSNDATTLPEPAPALLDEIAAGIAGLRVGYDPGYATRDVDERIAAAVAESVRALEALGAEIVDVELPPIDPYTLVWPTLCSVEALAAHAETFPSRARDYGPWFRGWLELGASKSAVEYAEACDLRAELTGLLARAFDGIDMLACPAGGDLPHPVSEETLYDGPMVDHGPVRRRFAAPWDMNRAPTLTLPNGWTEEGLPTALQLVGSPGDEAVLCRAGYAFEQATDYRRHPSV
ncbi:MAG: amidase [Chloroflexi bacterium]|nr:amidase [Chloroflexota bacterium]MYC47618.1 amidase [Chloroflexota bacterium]